MSGKLICFYGLDGAGKTTQANLLKDFFHKELQEECFVFHGHVPSKHVKKLKQNSELINKKMHKVFTPEICSFSFILDVWENTQQQIVKKLASGVNVVTDKYTVNSLVYSKVFGSETLFIEEIVNCLPQPDLYVYLSIKPETSHKRVINRNHITKKPIGAKENLKYMNLAAKEYDNYFSKNKRNSIKIDATLTAGDINKEVVEYLKLKLL